MRLVSQLLLWIVRMRKRATRKHNYRPAPSPKGLEALGPENLSAARMKIHDHVEALVSCRFRLARGHQQTPTIPDRLVASHWSWYMGSASLSFPLIQIEPAQIMQP